MLIVSNLTFGSQFDDVNKILNTENSEYWILFVFSISHLEMYYPGSPHLIVCSRFKIVIVLKYESIVFEICAFIYYMILMWVLNKMKWN